MDVFRNKFDKFYDLIKPTVFKLTEHNPNIAHRLFTNSLKVLELSGLAGLMLDNTENHLSSPFVISNAAGFNKNAYINPKIIKLLGFDRAVIGTVTYDSWEGNSEPNIKRFNETNSLVNWMGLPGIGAKKIARQLEKYYDECRVPLTINLMSTPGKEGTEALIDLERTILALRDFPYVDCFELNISCPNTQGNDGKIDTRTSHLRQLNAMINIVKTKMFSCQNLYLKVSPDLNEKDVDDIVRIAEKYNITGYVTTNTTTNHDPKYITEKMKKGGASGDAVYDASMRTQRYFAERIEENRKLIACGGINSIERMIERCEIGNCSEVQIFTPLIFKGTSLLRKLRAKNI